MVNSSVIPMVAAFGLDESITTEFERWMEEDHIPKMKATGHFEETSLKIPLGPPSKGMRTLAYIHEAKSAEELAKYEEGRRPALRQEFVDRWMEAISQGLLVPIVAVGRAEVLEA